MYKSVIYIYIYMLYIRSKLERMNKSLHFNRVSALLNDILVFVG